jgi:predicted nicotinamide N-methyase
MKAIAKGCLLLFCTSACALFVPRHYSFPCGASSSERLALTVFEQVDSNNNNNNGKPNKIQENQLGFETWKGGELLAAYLLEQSPVKDCSGDASTRYTRNAIVMKGATVLELGCGVGLPGIMAAKLGATTVIQTDMTHQLLETARLGAQASGVSDKCLIQTLDWKDVLARNCDNHVDTIKRGLLMSSSPECTNTTAAGFDYIIASDCVYSVETARLLARAVTALADSGRTEFVAVTGSRADRAGVEMFQKELQKAGSKQKAPRIYLQKYDSADFWDRNGKQLPPSNGGDLYGNLLWRVTWGDRIESGEN